MINAYATNTLRYNPELCTGCKMCSTVCPQAVFAQENHVARIVNSENCIECGACQRNCPTSAITVDSGVGCAYAMMYAALTGKKEPTCGGQREPSCCCSSDNWEKPEGIIYK